MRNLKDPYFLFFCFLFAANKVVELNGIFIPFIHSYMDDLICLPVLSTITLFVFREFIYGTDDYFFPLFYLITAVVMLTVVFEIILPASTKGHTADLWDILAYSLGAVFFYFRHRLKINGKSTISA
ncbi:MAG: magnesium citrate secondary transporter [Cytophagaceae bacterium]